MPAPASRKTIFVAEDDNLVRELVLTRLALAGHHTRWADNGSEALAECNRLRPDALILDINLPGLDGLSILHRWKEQRILPPPTLMLTARHRASDVAKAIKLGAKDYLTKPFDDKVLLIRTARLLRAGPTNSPDDDNDLLI